MYLVHVGRDDTSWSIRIDDDGRGFNFAGQYSQEQLDRERRGPVVIKERVRAIGGELRIDSDPGHGARLEVRWPFSHGTVGWGGDVRR